MTVQQDEAAEVAARPAAPGPNPTPTTAPRPVPADAHVELPDGVVYRAKRRFLGNPLHSDQIEHQRLGKPTALAVFASDNLSSSAYAT